MSFAFPGSEQRVVMPAQARVRPAAVAGMFYPADAERLRAEVRRYIDQAAKALGPIAAAPPPKAIIGPHAGYGFSGATAGFCYARLGGAKGSIKRVVLIGPAHRVHVPALATTIADGFATPLGVVRVDRAAVDLITMLPFVGISDAAHAPEHGLEVHLPFIQETLGDVSIVPVIFGGQATWEHTARVLELLWGGPETLIVISSDLSHYHGYDTAKRLDSACAVAIEAMKLADIGEEQACGRLAIQGLLAVGGKKGLHARTLDLRSSGDAEDPRVTRDRVVGYGAWEFGAGKSASPFAEPQGEDSTRRATTGLNEVPTTALTPADHQTLLGLARESIAYGLKYEQPLPVLPGDHTGGLAAVRATFVTLKIAGQLRGCIGTLEAHKPLAIDVARNAFAAAFRDPRFSPLAAREFDQLHYHISVLSPPAPLPVRDEADLIAQLRPHVDGVVLVEPGAPGGPRRGTFLPAVWETLPDPRQFVQHLKVKAGLAPDYWSPTLQVLRYTAESIGEE